MNQKKPHPPQGPKDHGPKPHGGNGHGPKTPPNVIDTPFGPVPVPVHPHKTRLMLCPRNYTGWSHVSHTGLAISATNTARVLRDAGIDAIVRPIIGAAHLGELLMSEHPSHVVVNALWIPTTDLSELVQVHSNVVFAVNCHSNIGFLQVEPNGLRLLREAIDLERSALGNFHVGMNSRAGAAALADSMEAEAAYLPNLYHLTGAERPHRPSWQGGTLRIGAFGAPRPLKNPTSAAFAALAIAATLGTNLEYHINTGRNDGGGVADRLLRAIAAVFAGLPNAKLVCDNWTSWPNFRRIIRHMHLLLQPSFTESFNMVTADGVAEGVASVVSPAIEWAPEWWKAPADDTEAIARTGRALISDSHTGRDGLMALQRHNRQGVIAWQDYLTNRGFYTGE